jgi:hypothetical protein
LGLTVADLRGTTLVHSSDEDGTALRTSTLAVQVVEIAGEALVEDGAATESKGTITAEGEAGGLLGTSLNGCIELEPLYG